MKLVCIVFNSVLMPNVQEHLEKCHIEKYTQWSGVTGVGEAGAHLGTHIWPGTNTIFFTIVADEEKKHALWECVKSIREKHPDQGIKAIVLNVGVVDYSIKTWFLNIGGKIMWQGFASGLLGLWLIGSTFIAWIPKVINNTVIGMIVLLLGLSINERWQGLVIASLGLWMTIAGITHGLIWDTTTLPHSLMLRVLFGNTHNVIIGGLVFVLAIWAMIPDIRNKNIRK